MSARGLKRSPPWCARLVLSCLPCSWVGCAPTAQVGDGTLEVVVRDDVGTVLPHVAIRVDGVKVGETGADGRVKELRGLPFRVRHAVQAECPDAYRPADARQVVLRQQLVSVSMVCMPKLRMMALAVRAPGAEGLPVRVDGDELGPIGPDGTLHALVWREPETRLRIALDTSSAPQLVPQNPSQDVTVPDRDDILLFEQTLRQPPKRKALRKRVETPKPVLPYAISRTRR